MESTASTPSTAREFQDTASPAVVSLYSVVPALIATKDGGATPVRETTSSESKASLTNTTSIRHVTGTHRIIRHPDAGCQADSPNREYGSHLGFKIQCFISMST